MDSDFLKIIISDPIYWGFTYIIPLEYALSVNGNVIVEEMKIYMKNFFNSHNLLYLKEGIDKLDLHLHQDIKNTDKVIYMCTSCKKMDKK